MNTRYKIQDTRYLPHWWQACKILICVVLLGISVFLLLPLMASAASLTVTPVVIDEKAKARDILKESLTLTNNTASKLNVYAFVNNIAIQEGKQEFLDPSRADQSSSLANWILFPRGAIELLPGEKKNIDFNIEVNLRAKAGMYHAMISLAEASTRDDAEKKIVGASSVSVNPNTYGISVGVNLEVLEDIRERLQLKSFISDKIFFSGFPVSFSYELENVGNRLVAPSGEIRIYDRRGREVASIPINDTRMNTDENPSLIATGENKKFASNWSGPEKSSSFSMLANVASALGVGGGFGKYKAVLDLEYGAGGKTLQDTVFFWIIPWKQIAVIFVGFLIFAIALIVLLHKRLAATRIYTDENTDKHRYKKVIDLRKNTKYHEYKHE